MPKVGGKRKKTKTHKQYDEEQQAQIPKSFVFKKGRVPETIKDIVSDVRNCMYPNTAMKLEDASKLKLSAYVRASKYYGVTHLIAYHTHKSKNYVRFIKNDGPVITFRIINYCRAKEIKNNVTQSMPFLKDLNNPLLVINNFNSEKGNSNLKQISNMLQGMFPALNMTKIKPENLKRVISFTYKSENQCIYFRHYRIKLVETGISNAIKEIIHNPKNLDFSTFKNFSQYFSSQNQGEGQNQDKKLKHTVKLYEVGPRMKLKFFNYEDHLNIKELPMEDQNQQEAQNQENVQQQYQQQQEGNQMIEQNQQVEQQEEENVNNNNN